MAGPALTGRGPPAPGPLTSALAHAREVAADWRAAGLQVGLVEHASRDGGPDGHVLIARSPTRVLHCACRPVVPRAGRALWTIEFWCRKARELRVLYGFAEVAAGPRGGTAERRPR